MAMTFSSKGSSKDFPQAPSGSHMAVCDMVVDLGVQPGTGMYPKDQHKIYLRFEIPTERIKYTKDNVEHEGPLVIGKFFTASMHEKANLRIALAQWRGKAFSDDEAEVFDVSKVLGKPCLLNIVDKMVGDKPKAQIAAIAPPMKGYTVPVAELPLLLYTQESLETYNELPEWIRKMIDGQIKPQTSHATGSYSDQPPVDSYEGGFQATDEDLPDFDAVPF